MSGEAFAADLLRAAACTQGGEQLDAVGVKDAEYCGSRQEGLRPVWGGAEEAQEPRPRGYAGA